jgi:TPR repeat protein
LYDDGRGVSQDYRQSVQRYLKSAEQGNAAAQFNLGLLYDNGLGGSQDYVEAHKWENLAAARAPGADQKRYADARDTLAMKMTQPKSRKHRSVRVSGWKRLRKRPSNHHVLHHDAEVMFSAYG